MGFTYSCRRFVGLGGYASTLTPRVCSNSFVLIALSHQGADDSGSDLPHRRNSPMNMPSGTVLIVEGSRGLRLGLDHEYAKRG